MGKIVIKIRPDGMIEAETLGIKGKKCKEYMEILEKFLDSKIIDSEYTKEYYEEEISTVKNEISQNISEDDKITIGKK